MDIKKMAMEMREEATRLEAEASGLRRAADALAPPGTDRMARARAAKAAKAAQGQGHAA